MSPVMSIVDDMTVTPQKKSTALQRLMERAGTPAVRKPQRDTVARRKAQLLEDLDGFNIDRLISLRDEMSAFVDLITSSLGDEPILAPDRLATLGAQALARRGIAEFLEACQSRIRDMVFSHLDAVLAEQGADDPSTHNASVEIPTLGIKFCREGAGYSDPKIDDTILMDVLGDDWDKVYTEEVIPEYRVRTLNTDALLELVSHDPGLLEKIRTALQPGTPKTPRMVIRNI